MAQLVKTMAGLAIASVKTVNGLAIASAKTIAGLDNTGGGSNTEWMAGITGGSTRTGNYQIGIAFTPASSLTITHLGRYKFSGNSQTHVVSIYSSPFSSPVLVASATVDCSTGSAGSFVYATASATLTGGVQYALVSDEPTAGTPDVWAEQDTSASSVTAAATLDETLYRDYGTTGNFNHGGNVGNLRVFVPPNFKY